MIPNKTLTSLGYDFVTHQGGVLVKTTKPLDTLEDLAKLSKRNHWFPNNYLCTDRDLKMSFSINRNRFT